MNKICTSIEQSKKLIELGIDVNTADMLWTYDFTVNDINGLNVISKYLKPEENDIFAWSLTALMKLMPERIKIGEELSFCLTLKKSLTGFSLGYNLNGSTFVKDNPLDAVFEMVCWLLENKKL